MREWNQDRNRQIADLFLKTKNTRIVADTLGIRIATVRYTLKQMKLYDPESAVMHRPNSACSKNSELVLKMCNDGHSLNEIANAVGTTGIRVKQFLRRNGVTKSFPNTKTGHRHYAWKGRTIDGDGYVLIHHKGHPNARQGTHYIFEHRLVVEKALGRYLLPTEVVHHKDGNKANNSIENLQVFQSNGDHLAVDLKGRCPKWSEEGRKAILAGVRRTRKQKHQPQSPEQTSIHPQSTSDVQKCI